MNRLAYDSLAREVLWLLLDSGRLRPATLDRMVAWEVYFLPPRVVLHLPDEDRFTGLLDPRTRREHAAMLSASIMHIATTEDRDGWVVWTQDVEVSVHYAEGRSRPAATPSYAPRTVERAEGVAASGDAGEALLKLQRGADTLWLARGDGLVAVSRGRWRPRVTLIEAVDEERGPDGETIAWLIADGPMRIEHGDGRVEDKPARSRVGIERDMRVVLRGNRLRRLWQRGVELSFEVLGAARMARPRLQLTCAGEAVSWDRNRDPRMVVGEAVDTRLPVAGLDLELTAELGDEIVVRNRSHEDTWLTWWDKAPLRVAGLASVNIQASHLRGLGAGDAAIGVRLQGAPASEPPRVVELHGRMQKSAGGGAEKDPIFGFEQAIATVYQDGVLLDAEADGALLRVPVEDVALVRPLLRIAFDGCGGAKVMPLDANVGATDLEVTQDAWAWVQDVVSFALPGLRVRLEAAAGRPRLVYGRPVRVRDVSADPEDRWQLHGWRFRVAANGLAVNGVGGAGEPAITVDRQEVTGPALLPPVAEHHVQAGSGMYRIVRRTGRASVAREA